MRTFTSQSVRILSLTAAATLLLAGCGDDESSDDVAAASDQAAGELVSTRTIDGAEVLVDSGGRSLYTAAVEQGGIRCTGGCLSFWDPLEASSAEAKAAQAAAEVDFEVVKRPDGVMQLSAEGLPLYTFTEEGPGELTGDGFVDDFEGVRFEWQAVMAGGASGSDSAEPSQDSSASDGGGY